jgi:hypothetical protein
VIPDEEVAQRGLLFICDKELRMMSCLHGGGVMGVMEWDGIEQDGNVEAGDRGRGSEW